MPGLQMSDFKIAYASAAIPVRYAVERGQWAAAAAITPPAGAPFEVQAVSRWARGLGLVRSGHADQARPEVMWLETYETVLRRSGNLYWATQVKIQRHEVEAWAAAADGRPGEAIAWMRDAADEEDAIEKLPVTPGPIIPAREQLGSLLLEQNEPSKALKEFQTALVNAPGRRGAIQGSRARD